MIKIHIINKIGDKVQEYHNRTGISKSQIAKEMGYKSKQALEGVISSKNPTIKTLVIFSYFFNCDISELFEVNIKNK
jgi:transcriptional regulator with XRE-family HTH domain